jgi:hypothetical protein
MHKLLISASALVLGMTLSSAALADAGSIAGADHDSTANSSALHQGDTNSSSTKTVNLSTGAVTSNGANDFSGIQTANYNTGFGSAVQGATSLAATSSISFTDGNN